MKDIERDRLGRAIHAAKVIGGPWGPPCGVEYDTGTNFECECSAMAAHLINLMADPPGWNGAGSNVGGHDYEANRG
jgi:hypothetical protein